MNRPAKPTLAIVVPCYNEEQALPLSAEVFQNHLTRWISQNKISENSYVLFVDDGSNDKTWTVISELHNSRPSIKGLKLAQNVGHQHALYAGLQKVIDKCDCAISIDADLQDDVNAIEQMILEYQKGRDIVYGVRKNRTTDSIFKRTTAQGFYRFMGWLGVKLIYNHADFRLLSAKTLKHFCSFQEYHLFLRGLAILSSKNSSLVYYDRNERVAGESKYPLSKMLNFAWNGVTSFSNKPLYYIYLLGMSACLLSIVVAIYSLVEHYQGKTITGWTSIFISIYFLGGVQLLSIGVIGQYIGKIYLETKKRPLYFVEEELN